MEKKIAIIGAGVSGLAACKHTLAKGFQPIVFESQSGVGGVWSKTIKNTRVQTPKEFYQFSDFPWPDSVTDPYPRQQQVLEYLESYAEHFHLNKYIKFNTKVVSLDYDGPSDEEIQSWSLWGATGEPFSSRGKWSITVEDTTTTLTEIYQVDFVILCTGLFGDVPNIPDFPEDKGPSAFRGHVLHSVDYYAMDHEKAAELVKGKRVAIVGNQKSAMDIAMMCSAANGDEYPCTMLYRTAHWSFADHNIWGCQMTSLFMNRLTEFFFHKPGEGLLSYLFAALFYPVQWVFSRAIETDIKTKNPIEKYGMVPNHSFIQELCTCSVAMTPDKFYDKVGEGSIKLKKMQSFSFCKRGIIIDSDTERLEFDLVILATGYRCDKKFKEIFVSKTFQNCMTGLSKATIPLYRRCIHPQIPQLAVIGFADSIGNLYTSDMQSKWVAEFLDGTFKLPSVKEMKEHLTQWDEVMGKQFGKFYRRSSFFLLQIFYNDLLCKDMGWNPKRKKGFFADLLQPYGPSDYASP